MPTADVVNLPVQALLFGKWNHDSREGVTGMAVPVQSFEARVFEKTAHHDLVSGLQ